VVRVLPDQSMVSDRELHVLECPGCQRTEQRLVFTHKMEPFPSERMQQLPSVSSKVFASAKNTVLIAARNAWTRMIALFRVAAQNAWSRMVAMFRGSQDDRRS
jgi:hypothetical protein